MQKKTGRRRISFPSLCLHKTIIHVPDIYIWSFDTHLRIVLKKG